MHGELDRVFVMQVDVSVSEGGISETAQLAVGLVVSDKATSFEGESDGGDADAADDEETEPTEVDDTSGSAMRFVTGTTGILAALLFACFSSVL